MVTIEQRFKELYSDVVDLSKGKFSLRPADIGLGGLAPTRRASVAEAKEGKSDLLFMTPRTTSAMIQDSVANQGMIEELVNAMYDAFKAGAERIKVG